MAGSGRLSRHKSGQRVLNLSYPGNSEGTLSQENGRGGGIWEGPKMPNGLAGGPGSVGQCRGAEGVMGSDGGRACLRQWQAVGSVGGGVRPRPCL